MEWQKGGCHSGVAGPQAWVALGPSKGVRGFGVTEGCWDWAPSGWSSPVVWGFKLAVKRQSPLGRIRGLLAADGAQALKLAGASVAPHPWLHGKSQSQLVTLSSTDSFTFIALSVEMNLWKKSVIFFYWNTKENLENHTKEYMYCLINDMPHAKVTKKNHILGHNQQKNMLYLQLHCKKNNFTYLIS